MKVAQSCPILCDPMDYTVHGILQAWSGEPFPSPGNLPNSEIEFGSPTFQADSLPAKPQGKPKNTWVGNLSLLQGIFQTPESNRDGLHWRLILYQLSYEGSPGKVFWTIKIALKVSVHAHKFFFFFSYLYFIPLFSLSRNKLNYLFICFLFERLFAWSNMILGISWHFGHAQSCLTLCDPTDHSPPGSSVHRIFQARIWKWVVIFYSKGSSQPRDWTMHPLHLLHWQQIVTLSHGKPFSWNMP